METLTGFRVALFALLVVAGTWATYWARIKALRVPRRPIAYITAMVASIALATWSFVVGPGLGGGALAMMAIAGAGMLLFSTFMSPLPVTTPAVAAGEPILPFTAKDHAGNDFDLGSLAGRPYLLKFFRGHW